MKAILIKDVEKLGKAGDAIQIKDGYFRNYLLPRKFAVPSSTGGLRFLEAKKKQAIVQSEKLKQEAVATAERIAKVKCVIQARVGQEGKLFGSITTKDVHAFLEKQGISIDRKRIEMEPIHLVGEYQANIKLHQVVDASLTVTVKA